VDTWAAGVCRGDPEWEKKAEMTARKSAKVATPPQIASRHKASMPSCGESTFQSAPYARSAMFLAVLL
jgi:hypothetical protein